MSNVGSAGGAVPIAVRPSGPNSRTASRSTSSPFTCGATGGGRSASVSVPTFARRKLSSARWSAAESRAVRAASTASESPAARAEASVSGAADSGASPPARPPRAPPQAATRSVVASNPHPTQALFIASRKNSPEYGSSRSVPRLPPLRGCQHDLRAAASARQPLEREVLKPQPLPGRRSRRRRRHAPARLPSVEAHFDLLPRRRVRRRLDHIYFQSRAPLGVPLGRHHQHQPARELDLQLPQVRAHRDLPHRFAP